jgi:DNA-binding NarL/FixJ family response regulator
VQAPVVADLLEATERAARTVSVEVRGIVDWLGARSRTHAVAVLVGAA